MRKYQKAAVVAAMLGSVGFLGAGVSHGADEPKVELSNTQSNSCGNETLSGILNISRVQVNILAIPLASEVDQSKSPTCTNAFGVGGN